MNKQVNKQMSFKTGIGIWFAYLTLIITSDMDLNSKIIATIMTLIPLVAAYFGIDVPTSTYLAKEIVKILQTELPAEQKVSDIENAIRFGVFAWDKLNESLKK